jgi:hypothetical protein
MGDIIISVCIPAGLLKSAETLESLCLRTGTAADDACEQVRIGKCAIHPHGADCLGLSFWI